MWLVWKLTSLHHQQNFPNIHIKWKQFPFSYVLSPLLIQKKKSENLLAFFFKPWIFFYYQVNTVMFFCTMNNKSTNKINLQIITIQQLHLKCSCNLERYWLWAHWWWYHSIETCRIVVVYKLIVIVIFWS
jgi:hypothetical protein